MALEVVPRPFNASFTVIGSNPLQGPPLRAEVTAATLFSGVGALFTVSVNELAEEGLKAMIGTCWAAWGCRLIVATVGLASAAAILSPVAAEPLILQGSTTFNRRIMEPHEGTIEAKSGQEITVIPNRSMLGIIALMEGRAHMAMISASLDSEISKLKKAMPGLDYERLKAFEISSTRVAFVAHPDNPIRKASMVSLKKVLTGEITNWSALGGNDAPIRMVVVGGGGGVVTTVEVELLHGHSVRGPNMIYVKTALQLVGIVEQEPNALGIAQLSLARQKGLPEIATEKPVEQSLSLVTFGEPTPAMKAVIDAARSAVEKTM
jgi:ABC-type phosphate transport system substrate-binding protein